MTSGGVCKILQQGDHPYWLAEALMLLSLPLYCYAEGYNILQDMRYILEKQSPAKVLPNLLEVISWQKRFLHSLLTTSYFDPDKVPVVPRSIHMYKKPHDTHTHRPQVETTSHVSQAQFSLSSRLQYVEQGMYPIRTGCLFDTCMYTHCRICLCIRTSSFT